MRRPWLALGRSATGEKNAIFSVLRKPVTGMDYSDLTFVERIFSVVY